MLSVEEGIEDEGVVVVLAVEEDEVEVDGEVVDEDRST